MSPDPRITGLARHTLDCITRLNRAHAKLAAAIEQAGHGPTAQASVAAAADTPERREALHQLGRVLAARRPGGTA